tara:strand:+ start:631 stop:864 length:234 start_codon:yes stop_codon:yes gene_type:complete
MQVTPDWLTRQCFAFLAHIALRNVMAQCFLLCFPLRLAEAADTATGAMIAESGSSSIVIFISTELSCQLLCLTGKTT